MQFSCHWFRATELSSNPYTAGLGCDAHSIGGRVANVVLVEAVEVDDAERQRCHSWHSGDKGSVQVTGGLQVQAAFWPVCSKSGGLDIYGHLAQVPVRLPQPVDVGAEVVIIPVARLMS